MNRLPTRDEALVLLRRMGCSEGVIEHSKTVAEVAVDLAKKLRENGVEVDVELVEVGALLHDIGRAKTHDVRHGYIGGEIGRSLGLPEKLVKIIERHVGGGITAREAKELNMPPRDFIPRTVEEKIVAYADKLVAHNRKVDFNHTLEEFREKLGENHPAIKRLRKLHREMVKLLNLEG